MTEKQAKKLLEKRYKYFLKIFKLKERREYISSKIKFDTSLILKNNFFPLFEKYFDVTIINWKEIKLSCPNTSQVIGFINLESSSENRNEEFYDSFKFRIYKQTFSSNSELEIFKNITNISKIFTAKHKLLKKINKLYFKYITEYNENTLQLTEIQNQVKKEIDYPFLSKIENVILNKLQIEGIKFTEPIVIQNFRTEEKIEYIKIIEINPQTRYGVIDILTDTDNRYSYKDFYIQGIIPYVLDGIQKKNVSNI